MTWPCCASTPSAYSRPRSPTRSGDLTLALGNPLGLQSSVTEGIASALGRTVDEGNGVALPDVIQTSAAINPGNSGGALVNLQGQVIGIPTLAAVDLQLGGGAAPGIGFAVPSNVVCDIATQLINQGTVAHSNRALPGVQVATTGSGGGLIVGAVGRPGRSRRHPCRRRHHRRQRNGDPGPDRAGRPAGPHGTGPTGQRVPHPSRRDEPDGAGQLETYHG